MSTDEISRNEEFSLVHTLANCTEDINSRLDGISRALWDTEENSHRQNITDALNRVADALNNIAHSIEKSREEV